MLNLIKTPVRVAGTLFAASLLAAAQGGYGQAVPGGYAQPAQGGYVQPSQRGYGQAAPGGYAQPGTVNYVEGQVKLDGQSITANKIGSTLVSPGHILQTDDGKAEMLLTPGVFVRLDTHSQVKMISPSISDTRVELLQGRTMLEVAEIEKENHTEVTVGGTSTTVKARGIYEFTASPALARVFEGKAVVEQGSRSDYIHKGEQMALDATNPKLKTRDFNVKKTEVADDLYAWSKLRADYTAQANMSAAANYEDYGPGWYGSGWYWDPYFEQYSFLLADGFMWDPFGYGFFSPGYFGAYAPYFGYGGYGGYGYGRGGYGYGRGAGPGIGRGGAITRGSALGAARGGAITRGSALGAAMGGGTRGGLGGMRSSSAGFGGGGMHTGGGGFGGGGMRGGGGGVGGGGMRGGGGGGGGRR